MKLKHGLRVAVTAAIALALACGGNESAFDPAGPQAGRINGLWWCGAGTGEILRTRVTRSITACDDLL
jgi:hypothetical protein